MLRLKRFDASSIRHCVRYWIGELPTVSSEVCPLFFRLGQHDQLADLCAQAGLEVLESHRLRSTLSYANAGQACDAAFVGGPVALGWSRFNEETRSRVCQRYASAIELWRHPNGYGIPGEFVVVAARKPMLFNRG